MADGTRGSSLNQRDGVQLTASRVSSSTKEAGDDLGGWAGFVYSSIRSVSQNAINRVLICVVTHVSHGVVLFDGVGGEGM